MTDSPTILIYNVHSTLNAGDRALLECTLQQLGTNFAGARFIIVSNWPDEPFYAEQGLEVVPSAWICAGVTQRRPIVAQILAASWGWKAAWLEAHLGLRLARGDWRRLFDAYRQADLAVGVAGNQYFSTGRFGWPFPVTALAPALGHLFGKPVYTMPQSLGPLRRGWERRLLRWVYGPNRQVQVRDSVSLELARQIGLPAEKLAFIPDIAFDFEPAPREEALAVLRRYGFEPGRPAVGATVIADPGRSQPPGGIAAYYAATAEVLRRLGERLGLPVYIFVQVSGPTPQEDDRLAARQMLERLGPGGAHVRLVDEALPPALLKACYGCLDLFLPTRMHSGIFAMTMGVPCVFVGYLTKTRGVLQALGLEDWMVQVGSVETEALWQKVEAAWNERAERAERLRQVLPHVIADCRRSGKWIAEDFARHGR